MRALVEPTADRQRGYEWCATVEYGPNHSNTFVVYGPDPLSAALKLAEYIASELEIVRQRAREL